MLSIHKAPGFSPNCTETRCGSRPEIQGNSCLYRECRLAWARDPASKSTNQLIHPPRNNKMEGGALSLPSATPQSSSSPEPRDDLGRESQVLGFTEAQFSQRQDDIQSVLGRYPTLSECPSGLHMSSSQPSSALAISTM